MDFTLNKFEKLCEAIVKSKYTTMTLADYLQLGHDKNNPVIIMRHDIDRDPKRAFELAKAEHKYGIRATYYFRKSTYISNLVDKIKAFNHEIGFHYETVDKCNGNIEKAVLLFKNELAFFQTKYDIKTVCAHGNPLTVYDNKTIWKNLNLNDVGLIGEAYLSLDFNKFGYFSDSGRSWSNSRTQKMVDKDRVVTAFNQIEAYNTDDLVKIILDGSVPDICILSHPERWTGNIFSYIIRYIIDMTFSCGKVGIYYFSSKY